MNDHSWEKGARQVALDAGDYSMGTTFASAIRETGGELQLGPERVGSRRC
jgi:hypothetical protein